MPVWLLAIRPKTLWASISPIIVGNALAYTLNMFDGVLFLLIALCAISLQVAVNLANDLFDAKSGVDSNERVGPTRVLASGLVSEQALRLALYASCAAALVLGCSIIYLSHWILLIFGALSLLAVFAYSAGPFPLASHGLGELAVFTFFGLLAVGGSFYAQTGIINREVMGFAASIGLLSAAIMLVNNIRDIASDRKANKNTLAVKLGEPASIQVYKGLLLGAAVLAFYSGYLWGMAPLFALLLLPYGMMLEKMQREINQAEAAAYNRVLENTAKLLFLFSLCLSVAIVSSVKV